MRCLDIGSGLDPEKVPGWEHLDIREGPGIDWVWDCRDFSGLFPDEVFDRVNARDVIEHLPYRDVPHAVSEWLRILKPTGTISIQTPDLLRVVTFVDTLGPRPLPDESQWEHFNRIAFGHQNYEENFHKSLWTYDWLERLLTDGGAKRVWEGQSDFAGVEFRIEASKWTSRKKSS